MPIVLPTNADTDQYSWVATTSASTVFIPPMPKASYFFDASDAGPTDASGDWTNDANAFDGDVTTKAVATGPGILKGTGTTAPASGAAIADVVARLHGQDSTPTDQADAAVLTVPSGGWTWAKIQALHVEFTYSGGTLFGKVYESDGGTLLGTAGMPRDGAIKMQLSVLDEPMDGDTTKYMLLMAVGDDDAETFVTPSGFTEFLQVNDGNGDDASVAVWYRQLGLIQRYDDFAIQRTGAEETIAICVIVEGADSTTFEDLAFSEGSHFVSTLNVDGTPEITPQEIITATDDAVVIILTGNRSHQNHLEESGSAWVVAPPSGYTIESNATAVQSSNTAGAPGRLEQGQGAGDAQMSWMWKTVATADTETPGNITGFTDGRDMKTVTFAIRPAVDAGLDIVPSALTVTATPGTAVITTGSVPIVPAGLTVTATPGTAVVTQVTPITPAALSVTATPGTVTITTGSVPITPAAVTVTVTPGTATITTETPIIPSVLTVTATEGTLTVTTGSVSITPAAVSVTASAGTVVITTGSVPITPAALTVTVSAGTVRIADGIIPDPLTVTASPGTATVTTETPIIPAALTVTVTAGGLTITTGSVPITPAALTVTATPGTAVVTTETPIVPAALTVTATPGGMTVTTAGALEITPAAVTVTATLGGLTVTTGSVPIVPAALTVTATAGTVDVSTGQPVTPAALTVTATAGGLTITTGSVPITPEVVTVTVTEGTLTVTTETPIVPGDTTVNATAGTMTVTTGSVPIVPSALTVNATPGTFTVTTETPIIPAAVTVTVTAGGMTVTTGSVPIVPSTVTVNATAGTVVVVAPLATTRGFAAITDSGDQATASITVAGASGADSGTGAAIGDSGTGASMTDD